MTLSNILAHTDVIWDSADAAESCWQLGLAYVAVSPYAVSAEFVGVGATLEALHDVIQHIGTHRRHLGLYRCCGIVLAAWAGLYGGFALCR